MIGGEDGCTKFFEFASEGDSALHIIERSMNVMKDIIMGSATWDGW